MPTRHWSEELARVFLERKGWALLARNYTVRFAEIDLVMRDDATIVFVEVRQRASERWGGAAASIDARKIARIRRAAQHFMVTRYDTVELPMRLDAILVRGTRAQHEISHVRAIG